MSKKLNNSITNNKLISIDIFKNDNHPLNMKNKIPMDLRSLKYKANLSSSNKLGDSTNSQSFVKSPIVKPKFHHAKTISLNLGTIENKKNFLKLLKKENAIYGNTEESLEVDESKPAKNVNLLKGIYNSNPKSNCLKNVAENASKIYNDNIQIFSKSMMQSSNLDINLSMKDDTKNLCLNKSTIEINNLSQQNTPHEFFEEMNINKNLQYNITFKNIPNIQQTNNLNLFKSQASNIKDEISLLSKLDNKNEKQTKETHTPKKNFSEISLISHNASFKQANFNNQSQTITSLNNKNSSFRKKNKNVSIDSSLTQLCSQCNSFKVELNKLRKEKMDMKIENSNFKKEIKSSYEMIDSLNKKVENLEIQHEKDYSYFLKQEKEIRRLTQIICNLNEGLKNSQFILNNKKVLIEEEVMNILKGEKFKSLYDSTTVTAMGSSGINGNNNFNNLSRNNAISSVNNNNLNVKSFVNSEHQKIRDTDLEIDTERIAEDSIPGSKSMVKNTYFSTGEIKIKNQKETPIANKVCVSEDFRIRDDEIHDYFKIVSHS